MPLQIKTGKFTTTTTGNVVISDVGFQADVIFIIRGPDTDPQTLNTISTCFGVATATDKQWGIAHFNSYITDATKRRIQRDDAVALEITNSILARGEITVIDSAGFTINFTTHTSATRHWQYVAVQGGTWEAGTFVGNGSSSQDVPVPFQPAGLMLVSVRGSSTIGGNSRVNTGLCDSALNQVGLGSNNSSSSDVKQIASNTKAFMATNFGSPSLAYSGAISGLTPTGFSIDWTDGLSTPTDTWFYLAFKDVNVAAGQFVQPSSPGVSADVAGLSFKPEFVYLENTGLAANDSFQLFQRYENGFCFTDGGVTQCGKDTTAAINDTHTYRSNTNCTSLLEDASAATVEALASLSSFNSDGFSLNWSVASANANLINYLALADAVAPAAPKSNPLLFGQDF